MFIFPGNHFCSARNEKMIRYKIWFVNSKSLRIGLNFIKVKCYFRMFCIFCIFVVLTILPGSYTAPSPSPQVSAIPEKRKKWCMKICSYIVYRIIIFYGLWQQKFFRIEFTDGSPDQATAYQKEKMKKEMSKRMSGNVNSVIHKHEHANI